MCAPLFLPVRPVPLESHAYAPSSHSALLHLLLVDRRLTHLARALLASLLVLCPLPCPVHCCVSLPRPPLPVAPAPRVHAFQSVTGVQCCRYGYTG